MRYFIALILITFSGFVSAQKNPDSFFLTPDKCVVSGDVKGSIKTTDGDPVNLECRVKSNKMFCKQIHKEDETYNIGLVDSVGFADSESGNIKMILDFKKKHFSLGMVQLNVLRGSLVTKSCVGKIVPR